MREPYGLGWFPGLFFFPHEGLAVPLARGVSFSPVVGRFLL